MTYELFLLAIAVFTIALLFSSVGHGGASGYIAAMSLFDIAPEMIKPTGLVLNILVASISAFQFWRSGFFSWRLFFPFAILAIPLSFLGGYLHLPTQLFKIFLGLTLLLSAIRFLIQPLLERDINPPSWPIALSTGGVIGFLAGLTGTGGGIFLTPLFYFFHWAEAKQISAVSALFILTNSIAGLLGNLSSAQRIPEFAGVLAIASLLGATLGAYFGSQRLSSGVIQRSLAVVLAIAAGKLLLI
jgi:uncharacterized protein